MGIAGGHFPHHITDFLWSFVHQRRVNKNSATSLVPTMSLPNVAEFPRTQTETKCCAVYSQRLTKMNKYEKVALTHMSALQCLFLICLDVANVGWDELTVCNLKPEISGVAHLIYSSSWRVGEFGGDGSVVESSVVLNFWPYGQTWNFKV